MNKNLSEILFEKHKEQNLFGRYIAMQNFDSIMENLENKFSINTIGHSVKNKEIKCIRVGHGKIKILMWSQMHGNETTTTKALFDLVNTLSDLGNDLVKTILTRCSIVIVPMLNPDGAEAYTRFNANQIDLNRDAIRLTQPESRALRGIFDSFSPDYCFNLHGQRTIFSAGNRQYPATVSFLAPTQDSKKTLTENRKKAMHLIAVLNSSLQNIIPDCVGVYDDSFNLNCVGDYFQAQGVATILFEAGHHHNDYHREYSRYLIYHSFLVALNAIASDPIQDDTYKEYFDIPENEKNFFDIILRNVKLDKGNNGICDIAVQYEEVLSHGKIDFQPRIEKIANLQNYYGHKEIDFENSELKLENDYNLKVGSAIDFVNKNNERLLLKL